MRGVSVSDWIGLGVSVGTIALAVMAFASILESRQSQRREQRQKLLSEIIDWAEQIQVRIIKKVIPFETEGFTFPGSTYAADKVKSTYIFNITSKFPKILKEAVKKTVIELDEHIELEKRTLYGGEAEQRELFSQIEKHEQQLVQSAQKVVEEAVKLKIKELG